MPVSLSCLVMPSWIAELVRLDGSGSTFRTTASFGAGPRLFGGLIAAQALAAAGLTIEPDRLPQSLHAYFIKGGRVGVDVEYTVELTRDVAAGETSQWPLQPFWFRSRRPVEDDALLQACALTFVSDLGMVSTARPPGEHEPGPGGAASLDHALWLHRRIDPNEWHCYDAVGVTHSDARGLAFGTIHDTAGTLVASVAQESLWRL